MTPIGAGRGREGEQVKGKRAAPGAGVMVTKAERLFDHPTMRHALQLIGALPPKSVHVAPEIAARALKAAARPKPAHEVTARDLTRLLKQFDLSLPVRVMTSEGQVPIERLSVLQGNLVIHA